MRSEYKAILRLAFHAFIFSFVFNAVLAARFYCAILICRRTSKAFNGPRPKGSFVAEAKAGKVIYKARSPIQPPYC